MKFKAEKRIIVIPDSFKGTMSSSEICHIMEKTIHQFLPEVEVTRIPIADGGEGTVDALLEGVGGKKIKLCVQHPLQGEIDSFYAILDNEMVAVEMAAAAGLPLMDKLDVLQASTYGVGQLLKDALDKGQRDFIIGLGGSATNDGGAGACAALGIEFLNEQGEKFVPVGATLKDICSIDMEQMHPGIKDSSFHIMSDINNPLCGENGAAAIFGPQKGASDEVIKLLDEGLRNFAEVIRRDLGVDILQLPGAGAAGGMGGGLYALLQGKLESGIDVMLDTVKFDNLLQDTSLVFTGEGKIDAQSLGGKVVIGIAKRAKTANVPVIAVVGDIGDSLEEAYQLGISAICSINRVALPYQEAKKRAKSDLELTVREIMRLLSLN